MAIDFSADAFRVPIDYVLEARYRNVVQAAMTLPWWPRSFSTRKPSHAQVVHLLNGQEIREHGRYRHVEFVLEGNSGYAARPGYDRYGQVILATGPEIFREFEKFLSLYQKEAEGEPNEWSMVFRAYDEDVHWLVEPGLFTWNRSADRSRFTYDWSLELSGYKEFQRELPSNLFSPLSDNFLAVADSIREVGNYVAIADNLLTNARQDLDTLRAPFQALGIVAEGLGGAVDSWREFWSFPVAAIGDLTAIAISLRSTYDDFITSPEIILEQIPAATSRLLTALGVQAEDSEAAARVSAGRSGGAGGAGTSAAVTRAQQRLSVTDVYLPDRQGALAALTVDYTNTVAEVVTVRQGEDLRDLAERVGLGDDWESLAVLNGLSSATEYTDGTLLLPGDEIRVPAETDGADSTLLNLAEFRDLEVNLDDGDLTFELLTPEQSTAQLITHKVTSVIGDSVWENFGMPNVVGSKVNSRLTGFVVAEATALIEQDLRVAGVTGIEAVPGSQGDSLVVTGEVILRGDDLRVPFAAVVSI